MHLTEFQRDIVIGTVLGGSSLIKVKGGLSHFLSMRSQNEEWLRYKTQELANCFREKFLKDGKTYRCQSKCMQDFTDLYEIYYKDGKRIVTEENLSPIKAIGIAIWFLDGGSLTGRNNKNAYFSTSRFGTEGTEVIRHYFNDILSFPCQIQGSGGRLRVLLTVEGTELFFRRIGYWFPECQLKKIDKAYGSNPALQSRLPPQH